MTEEINLISNKNKCLKYASKIKNSFYREFMEDQINSLFDSKTSINKLMNNFYSNIDFIINDAVDDENKSGFLNLTKNLMKIIFALNNCMGLHECINIDIQDSIKTDKPQKIKSFEEMINSEMKTIKIKKHIIIK